MKRPCLLLVILIHTFLASAQFPLSFKRKVKALPQAFLKPGPHTNLSGNGKKTTAPWIVFSDRDDNFTTTEPGGSQMMKKLGFMESFYVSAEKDGFVKLVKYNPATVKGRRIIDSKSASAYGWISRWKLLMWSKSFSDKNNGYPDKSIAIISGKLPLTSPATYYDRTDSAYVYSSPELKKVTSKIRLHQIAYIFKKSEDGRKFLIGNDNQLVADSARKVIYGWIAADAVHNWGQRLFIAPSPLMDAETVDSVSMITNRSHADPLLTGSDVVLKSAPVISRDPSGKLILGQATDVFDKSKNMLISIDGSPINFADYLRLKKNINKINVVFVIDGGSSMSAYFPGLTNTIQSFENLFAEYSKDNQLSYGAVVYRDNDNCSIARGISATASIYPDYRKLMSFLIAEAGKTRLCNSNIVPQPLHQGISTALEMLKIHPDETNLVVLIGSTGDATPKSLGMSEVFGKQDVRLLAIQAYSGYNQWYNNFVLQAKTLVSEAAVFSAARKKTMLINGEGLANTQIYNTTHLDSISFYLDYPANSLIQGGVVFPTKGSVNSNKSMHVAMRRFLEETDLDVRNQMSSLDSAFRLSGISNRNLSLPLSTIFSSEVDGEIADRMPHNGFKYYTASSISPDSIAKHRALMQYIVVLNGAEYKQFNDVLAFMSGQNIQAQGRKFRRKLLKNYLNIARKMLDIQHSPSQLYRMTLAEYFLSVTGLPLQNELFGNFTVADLANDKRMPESGFADYIAFLSGSAEQIKISTQVGQQFISNGKTYYYVTENNFNISKIPTK